MTKEEKFKDLLSFYLPKNFKGLSKKYILDCYFNENIQDNWNPSVGDLIVGETGNIYTISGYHILHPDLGGTVYFFGGGLMTKPDSSILSDPYVFVLNDDGLKYEFKDGNIEKNFHPNYYKLKDYKYIPYPHELAL